MNPDSVDLLRAFSDADVRFLVVGALRSRTMGDLEQPVTRREGRRDRVVTAQAAACCRRAMLGVR